MHPWRKLSQPPEAASACTTSGARQRSLVARKNFSLGPRAHATSIRPPPCSSRPSTPAEQYRLGNLVQQIRTPIMVTDPEGEQFWPGQSQRLYDALPGPKVLVPFTKAEGADMHCEPMARSLLATCTRTPSPAGSISQPRIVRNPAQRPAQHPGVTHRPGPWARPIRPGARGYGRAAADRSSWSRLDLPRCWAIGVSQWLQPSHGGFGWEAERCDPVAQVHEQVAGLLGGPGASGSAVTPGTRTCRVVTSMTNSTYRRWRKTAVGRIADVVTAPGQLAVHPAIPSRRVLSRQAQDHQFADLLAGPRSAWPVRVRPLAGDQAAVPGQQRSRRDDPVAP